MSNAIRTIRREMARAAGIDPRTVKVGRLNPFGTGKRTRGRFREVERRAADLTKGNMGLVAALMARLGVRNPARRGRAA